MLIIAYFSITVPFYGQSGGMGNSVLYRDRYRYVTVEKMDVETILEYIKVFQELYCSDLDKSFTRNGSYIEKFYRHYYFQEHYVRLPYNVFLEIEIAYIKPLFSRQRQHDKEEGVRGAVDKTLKYRINLHNQAILEEKMTFKGTIKIELEDKWYVATCLENNIASQGRTIDEAMENLKEAITLYYEDETNQEELDYLENEQVYITRLEMAI